MREFFPPPHYLHLIFVVTRVLFISIHRYECRKFWPNLREGDFDFIGDGSGRGFNINIPLNKTGMTDSDYLAIFHTLIMPIAYEFDPEIVLVSSGFDAAIGDAEVGNHLCTNRAKVDVLSFVVVLFRAKCGLVLPATAT
ncbi:unnamed protein product [Hydatigera taeniaeformis]|uniref:Hist_deacetyl domain-containing protein n=1 Tax=Hydatigena taeniaeformis TaxID=6205 RepID=A0A0R3WVV1_HYDTA|nr:unnamed protein product [Hydatigera taeniaeformis]